MVLLPNEIAFQVQPERSTSYNFYPKQEELACSLVTERGARLKDTAGPAWDQASPQETCARACAGYLGG